MVDYRKLPADEFVAWHDKYKAEHGYPLPGRNAATGKVVDVGWTTEYTDPVVDAGVAVFVVDIADPAKRPGQPVTKAEFDAVVAKLDPVAVDVDAEPVMP